MQPPILYVNVYPIFQLLAHARSRGTCAVLHVLLVSCCAVMIVLARDYTYSSSPKSHGKSVGSIASWIAWTAMADLLRDT